MMKVISIALFACLVVTTVMAGSVTLAVNQIPQWDICKYGGDIFSCSGHGMCSGPSGQCVCTGGYTGRDCSIPPGGFPYSTPISVTQFCQLETGGCAPGMCVGGGVMDSTSLPPGIDGVAAVNPTLYGSRYAYVPAAGAGSPKTLNGMYSFVGDACGTCWKLTRGTVSIVVTVVDRCAGYCRATVATPGVPNDQVCTAANPQGAKECGECIQSNHTSIPQCSCLSADSKANKGWCGGYPTAHCDWCAANDHPHFDLDITAQGKICGSAAGDGFCSLDSFQMVACPDLVGPWPNGYPNGTGAPSTSSSSSSAGSGSGAGAAGGAGVPTTCTFSKSGACSTVNEGTYMCNGSSLVLCHYGAFSNFGCPKGTACAAGVCQQGVTADPVISISASCSAAAAGATPKPAGASTNAPATSAPTQKPAGASTSAPATSAPATAAPTQKPAGTSTQTPVTPVATPAPSKIGHCGARKRSTQTEEGKEFVFHPELIQAGQVVVEEQKEEATNEVRSAASFVVPTFLVAFAAVALYL